MAKLFFLFLLLPQWLWAKSTAQVCERLFQSSHRPTFYVNSQGQAFPSIAYRYYSYKQLNELLAFFESKQIMIHEKNWIYITFEKYNTAQQAKEYLQVPHDASLRVTFSLFVDTAVIKIPKGKYGKAKWLEPFAKDHPQYGKGGGSQYILSHSKLKILEIYDLNSQTKIW